MTANLCLDCQTATAELDIRKRRLCQGCFIRYVSIKASKRMESFRFTSVNEAQPTKLLLPLSGGVSSLALLRILDTLLDRQKEKRNKTSYVLTLIHIRVPGMCSDVDLLKWTETIRTMFPLHQFLPVLAYHDIFRFDNHIEEDLSELDVYREAGESDADLFSRLLSVTRTATARVDLREILLQRLLVGIAREEACEGILWGHSDSRLAAKALAEVATGRGGAVPNAVTEGLSSFGVDFTHPVRDLFRSELEIYLRCQRIDILRATLPDDDISNAPAAMRNMSINQLLNGYISSQGEKYPGIMANVVRTASKLQMPTAGDQLRCKLCSTIRAPDVSPTNLCYGCVRMKQDIRV